MEPALLLEFKERQQLRDRLHENRTLNGIDLKLSNEHLETTEALKEALNKV